MLPFSLRLPYPVCTRFICHVFVCFASQTPGLCSASIFPSAPLPTLHTFLFLMFVRFASQTPGLCSAFNLPLAPLPSLHTFYLSCLVCFASLLPVLCCLSLVPLPFTQVCSFYQCVSPQKQFSSIFLGIFVRLCDYWLLQLFLVFLYALQTFAFPRCFHSDPCLSILYALFVVFFFYAL